VSVKISIQQKGILKRTLSLQDILMDTFHYGRYDANYIFLEGEMGEGEMTIYHPEHIARGISVIWNEHEKKEISLHMLLPTTPQEIDDLYKLVKHLCHLWKTSSFIQDDQVFTLDNIEYLKNDLLTTSYQSLCDFLKQHESGNFFCAMWPIDFESEKVQHWITDSTLKNFANDLHRLQNMDLYYANARLYRVHHEGQQEAIMGVYTVTATVDTIFPMQPKAPFSCVNFETGESMQVDFYRVALVSLNKKEMLGLISFDDFMNELYKKEVHEFDSEHIYFDGISEEEIQRLYDLYHL